MPLHGRLPARISPVTNGWWPHGHGGPAANAPARGFQIPISNSPDPNRRVHGAAVGGDRNAPLVFVVHGVRARKFPPCPGPLHRRLARSLLEYGRQPRRPGRPSSPPPPPAQAAGLPFPRPSSSAVRGPVRGTGPLFARITGPWGDDGGAAAKTCRRPAVSRTWISPGRPYPPGSGRRPLAYPCGRPANSQFGSQNRDALANWSAGARRRSRGTMTPAPWYCN